MSFYPINILMRIEAAFAMVVTATAYPSLSFSDEKKNCKI